MNEAAIWAMFYASVMGMGLHPGTTRDPANKMTPESGASLADDMLAQYLRRYPNA